MQWTFSILVVVLLSCRHVHGRPNFQWEYSSNEYEESEMHSSDDSEESETYLTAADFLRQPVAQRAHQRHGRHHHQYGDRRMELFEGDMIVENRDDFVSTHLADSVVRAAVRERSHRWPNGEIPYTIASSYSSNDRAHLAKALQDFHDRTCLRFIPYDKSRHRDYVAIMPTGDGCYSHLGRKGGRQELSLDTQCLNHGTIIHELMHAIGFVHEQSRTDRDSYVEIIFENVLPNMEDNFEKYQVSYIDSLGEAYDYASVMHYDRYAFSVNRWSATIVPKQDAGEGAERMGQREGFSASDLRKVNKLYECSSSSRNHRVTNPPPHHRRGDNCIDHNWRCSFYALQSQGYCERHARIRNTICPKSCGTCQPRHTDMGQHRNGAVCMDQHSNCEDWADEGTCRSRNEDLRSAMQILCPESCLLCRSSS